MLLRTLALALYLANFAWLGSSLGSLPDPVATHFNLVGFADGFSSGTRYALTMAALITLFASLTAVLPALLRRTPTRWLAMPGVDPSRVSRDTLNLLMTRFSHAFGVAMASFLLWIQWLTVQANQLAPARLDIKGLYLGLSSMLLTTILLILWLVVALYRADRA
ncbi:MAG: DUF1648 domain-containing protein [Alcanivoracaceae bacterium]